MRRSVMLVALLGLLQGCGWLTEWASGTDNSVPPTPLVSIANPMPVREVWSTSVGDGADKAFVRLQLAFDQGSLYAASRDGIVMALDAASGRKLWSVDTDLPITGALGVGSGLVVFGTNKGEVVALRAENGTEAWRSRVSSEVLAAPRLSDGIVVVRVADGRFFGFDAASGTVLWNYASSVPLLSLRGTSAPLLGQGVLIAGLDSGRLLMLDLRQGRPLFQKILAAPRGKTEMERLVDVDAEPRIAGSTLFVAPYHGAVSAVDLTNGNLLWNRDLSTYAGLDVDALKVYVSAADDVVWALDRRSGEPLWKNADLLGRHLTAPVAAGPVIAVGDFEGYVHLLDAENGRIVGRVRPESKGVMSMLLRNGLLFVYGKDGTLAAYSAN